MKPRCAPASVSLPADSFPLAGGSLGGRPYGSPLQISKNVCANRETREAQVCRPYGVGRRESQSWREAQGPPLRFQFPQRRSAASYKVLLRRVSCFAAKRGLIARERPRPASLGLRPIPENPDGFSPRQVPPPCGGCASMCPAGLSFTLSFPPKPDSSSEAKRSFAQSSFAYFSFKKSRARKVRAGRSSGRPGQSRYLLGEAP